MGPLAGARLTGSEMGMGGFDGDMKMKMYKKMGGLGGFGDMKMKMYKKMGGLGGFGDMKMKKYKKMGGLGGFGSAEGSAESMGPLAGARLTGSEMGMGGFD